MASYDDTATVIGSVVGFSNGADSVPLKNWLVTLPASLDGYTAISGTKSGKNLLDTSTFADLTYYTVNADGSVTVNSSDSRSWSTISADIFLKAGTYTLSRTLTGSQCYIRSSLDNYASNVCSLGNSATKNSFTLTGDAYIKIKVGYNGSYPFTDTYQLEVGSTESTFEKYEAPTTYTASLGRTIYGGQADIVIGQGIEEREKVGFDGSDDENWSLVATGTYRYSFMSQNFIKTNTMYTDILCDTIEVKNTSENVDGGITCRGTSYSSRRFYIFFPISNSEGVNDLTTFKAWLSNNPCNIVYAPTTPETFTFDPVAIETAKGSNTLWSDQGNTELTYYKDGYGFTSVTVHKETTEGDPVEQTAKLHRIVYGGLVDVISGKAEPKNVLKVTGEKTTYADIIYTVNDKGQVMANGTATALRSFRVIKNGDPGFQFKKGVTYTLSGCPSGGSDQTYQLDLRTTNSVGSFFMNAKDYGNGVTFTPTEDAVAFPIILVKNGQVCDNLTFNPQIEVNSSKTEYTPHFDPFTFPPISMETDEGENTLYADQGDSAITYRKAVD